jgi:hypothetical protein
MSSLKQRSIFECFGLPRPVVVQPATPPVLNDSRPAKKAKKAHEPRAFAHARWMALFSMLAFAYASVHVIAVQPWVLRASSWPGHENYDLHVLPDVALLCPSVPSCSVTFCFRNFLSRDFRLPCSSVAFCAGALLFCTFPCPNRSCSVVPPLPR